MAATAAHDVDLSTTDVKLYNKTFSVEQVSSGDKSTYLSALVGFSYVERYLLTTDEVLSAGKTSRDCEVELHDVWYDVSVGVTRTIHLLTDFQRRKQAQCWDYRWVPNPKS